MLPIFDGWMLCDDCQTKPSFFPQFLQSSGRHLIDGYDWRECSDQREVAVFGLTDISMHFNVFKV